MALKSNFNESKSIQDLIRQEQILYEKIIRSFDRAGLNFVTQARQQVQDHALGTYIDQTTNLRNSIGYFIFQDGKLVRENTIGDAIANREMVKDLVIPKGIQLIGIAGMNYASYVESKGYNVISNQGETCIMNLTNYLETAEAIEKTHDTVLQEQMSAAGNDYYDAGL
jgi:hypothetical protein